MGWPRCRLGDSGLVVVIFIDVVMRYLFNTSYVFTQELEWHLFGFIFLIGAGYTLLHRRSRAGRHHLSTSGVEGPGLD